MRYFSFQAQIKRKEEQLAENEKRRVRKLVLDGIIRSDEKDLEESDQKFRHGRKVKQRLPFSEQDRY